MARLFETLIFPLTRQFILSSPIQPDVTLTAIGQICQTELVRRIPQRKPLIGSVDAPNFRLELPVRGILAVDMWCDCTLVGSVSPSEGGAVVEVVVRPNLGTLAFGIFTAIFGLFLPKNGIFWPPVILSVFVFFACWKSVRKVTPAVRELFARSLGISQRSDELFDYAETNQRAEKEPKNEQIVKLMLIGICGVFILALLVKVLGVLHVRGPK